MTGPVLLQADFELALCNFIREQITRDDYLASYPVLEGFEVGNVEPPEDSLTFPKKLVVVRDDGSSPTDVVTADTSMGVSVLIDGPDASLAARLIHAIVRDAATPGSANPFAAVTESRGPYRVPEPQPRQRWYSTHVFATVGSAL